MSSQASGSSGATAHQGNTHGLHGFFRPQKGAAVAKPSESDAALAHAVDALEAMLRDGVPHPDQGHVMAELNACAQHARISNAARDQAIQRMAACAQGLTLVPATYAVFGCGLCIENGGNAEPAVTVTLRFAKESVHYAASLFRAAVKAREGQTNAFMMEELALLFSGGQLSPLQLIESIDCPPEERVAANMYSLLSPALYNVLSQSAEARRLVLADADFMRDLRTFRNLGQCPESQVLELLGEHNAEDRIEFDPPP
jgi:hypothetical protein